MVTYKSTPSGETCKILLTAGLAQWILGVLIILYFVFGNVVSVL